jgi:acetylornithine deacetylase/succinyl-diaminopimelate desuccinylase-like protein
MVGGIKGIARRPFDGDTRRGPRHSYLLSELRRRGCSPSVDRFGNIWVEKGSGSPTVLFSSHLDVDPRVQRVDLKSRKAGSRVVLTGILDNAVGCYINLLLAQNGPRKGRAIYVFTASEEIGRHNPRQFARSAREVVNELKRRDSVPDVCIAIDVTYPRLLRPQKKLDWSKEYGSLFDVHDETHCYLDGFARRSARRAAQACLRRFRGTKVALRNFHGHDEAFVYDRISPSFAFGPVVYGHFDQADQTMPLSHLRTALRFLRNV